MSFRPVALDAHLNAHAATWDDDRAAGTMTAWGNSFPAEELPFGRTVVVGGVPFALPPKHPGGFDHVEALGQTIVLDGDELAGLAVLCCGEMGDHQWPLLLDGPDGRRIWTFDAPEWTVPRRTPLGPEALACEHLHYVGGYELDHLRPVAWAQLRRFDRPLAPAVLHLPERPLVHLFAVTLLLAGRHG